MQIKPKASCLALAWQKKVKCHFRNYKPDLFMPSEKMLLFRQDASFATETFSTP